jgi:hypothetical protein
VGYLYRNRLVQNNSLSQSGSRVTGWGRVRPENRLWMAMIHMEAMGTYVWVIRLFRGEVGEHRMVEIKLLFIRWLSAFLKLV